MKTKVKEYKSRQEFEKDANKMLRDGWHPQGQNVIPGHVELGRTLIKTIATGGLSALWQGPGGGFSRSKERYVVTWVKL